MRLSYAKLIVNPMAGAGRSAKQWPQIMGLLTSLGLRFDHDLTEGPGHATELAKSAAKNGYELVVSVGGDGSLPSCLMGSLTTWLSYKNTEVSLKVDGKTEDRKVCEILMSNGKYGGGSMLVAPDADPTDGFLDLLIIDELSKPALLWSLPRICRGTHLTHPKVNVNRARI